ncbi:MAG: helix-turn-helix transcriptional regulator [Pseudomonadota bacterium]
MSLRQGKNPDKLEMRHIDAASLASPITSDDRYKTMQLRKDEGRVEFRIGKISRDVSFTRSRCLAAVEYEASIQYNEDTTLLIFGLQGLSHFRIDGLSELHTVRTGDVWHLRMNSGTLYRTTPPEQENEMVVIKYTGQRLLDAIGEIEHGALSESVAVNRLGHQATADFGISELLQNPLGTASERLLAESHALQLLGKWIAPGRQALVDLPNPADDQLSDLEKKTMRHVVKSLTRDMVRPPSLHQLAVEANMSHTRLNRCFRKAFGSTVYHWLRNYRLEQARHYLDNADSSITDIAFRCGFSSASHFAQSFKQQYACSPAAYRSKPR